MAACNISNRSIFYSDNLEVLRGMPSACIDLIYLDPPFNKGSVFSAPKSSEAEGAVFVDVFGKDQIQETWLEELALGAKKVSTFLGAIKDIEGSVCWQFYYLSYMAIRLVEMRRVLKDTGSLYLHSDPTASHYLKLLLDCVFGAQAFRNEIIWYYKNASRGKKKFASAHDVIFWYTKDAKRYTFNREAILQPFDSGMTAWRYAKGGQRGKEMPKGKTPDDVQVLTSLNSMAKEHTGYPTQKPLALLAYLIKASSCEGDWILDPFCGSGTSCVAAERLGRQWIGIDVAVQARPLIEERLKRETLAF